jgi:hypothetical protein
MVGQILRHDEMLPGFTLLVLVDKRRDTELPAKVVVVLVGDLEEDVVEVVDGIQKAPKISLLHFQYLNIAQ